VFRSQQPRKTAVARGRGGKDRGGAGARGRVAAEAPAVTSAVTDRQNTARRILDVLAAAFGRCRAARGSPCHQSK
jgi:hypothetical protein